jgi:hypothetical protein
MKELAKQVEKLAAQVMQKKNSSTSNTVIEEGKRQVDKTVYSSYDPKVYERTGQLRESWEVENTSDGIGVFNTRRDEDTGKDIVDTIEYGRNYDYEFEYSNKPRPFVENTRESLRNGNQLKDSLKKDLKSIGLDVE